MSVLLDQPRDRLGQFASRACPSTLRVLEEAADARETFTPNRHYVPAPRCPHGSFMHWAKRNCCKKGTR